MEERGKLNIFSFNFIIIDLLLISAPAAYFIAKKRPIAESLGIYSNGLKTDFARAIQLLGALIIVSFAISGIMFFLGFNDLARVGEQVERIKAVSPMLLLYLLVVRVVAEEIFFRGFLIQRIGWIPSTVLFAIAHVSYGSVTEVLGALVLGALLAKAYERNRNIVPNIVAHMFYNLIFVAFMLA